MTVKVFNGVDKELYSFVAPLVMCPAVIRQNGGAPFRTSPKHTWVVALDNENNCIGFLPCLPKDGLININNYYVKDRNKDVLTAMLKVAQNTFKKEAIEVITQRVDEPTLKENGFRPILEWVNYVKYFIERK